MHSYGFVGHPVFERKNQDLAATAALHLMGGQFPRTGVVSLIRTALVSLFRTGVVSLPVICTY
jgi:hypothetical protein